MIGHPAFDLDWNLVRTFVAVAREGSLAGGARVLGITHPTAARHIQSLEESLGLNLFSRTGKGLVLNEWGERLQASAGFMHDSALAFQSDTDRLRERPVSRLRLSVAEILAELLPEIMLAELDPDRCDPLAVDMAVTNDLVNLLQREADMALRHVRPEQQELLCRRVGVLAMGTFADQAYVAQHGSLDADNVSRHRFIDGLSRDYLIRGAAREGMTVAPGQVVFRSDSILCQRAAVNAGWGIAALPVWMARQEPDWVSMFPADRVIDVDVWLVARPEVRESAQLRAIFTRLGEALEAHLVA